jgi:hypothetical protein
MSGGTITEVEKEAWTGVRAKFSKRSLKEEGLVR